MVKGSREPTEEDCLIKLNYCVDHDNLLKLHDSFPPYHTDFLA